MKIQAAIFDLDGTLLDSLVDISDSANTVLKRHGLPTFSCDEYRYFVGNGVRVLMERILPEQRRQDQPFLEEMVKELLTTYGQNWNNQSKLYDGVPEMLQRLVDCNMQLAVLSNKPHASTQRCVEYYLADFPLAAIFGQAPGRPHKPDPTGALEIARSLSLSPQACLLVGDTATDVQTALAAGMCPIGVTWGFRDRAELLEAGARIVIDQPSELFHIDKLAC